jgi:hypothetical protein
MKEGVIVRQVNTWPRIMTVLGLMATLTLFSLTARPAVATG